MKEIIESEMKKHLNGIQEQQQLIVSKVESTIQGVLENFQQWWMEVAVAAASSSISSSISNASISSSSGSEKEDSRRSGSERRKPLWSPADCTVRNVAMKLGMMVGECERGGSNNEPK